MNPAYPDIESQVKDVETAAAALGQRMLILKAANIAEIDAAFALVAQQRGNALMIGSDPFFDANRGHILPWQRAKRCLQSITGANTSP